MKKTIIKTALITILAVIAAVFVLFFTMFTAFPKALASVCKDVGFNGFALTLYEKQYNEKGNSFEDLLNLVDVAVFTENEEKISIYGEKLVIGQNSALKAISDSEYNGSGRDLYDYYATRTVEALYKTKEYEKCVEVAFKSSEEYSDSKSVYFVVLICLSKDERELASQVYNKYKSSSYVGNIISGKTEMDSDMVKLKEKYNIK